jgi:hypothetical protein
MPTRFFNRQVYFKYIPLQYGALGIAAAFVLYQIRSQMVARKYNDRVSTFPSSHDSCERLH